MNTPGQYYEWQGERPPVFVNGVWKSGNHLVYSALNQSGIEGPYIGFAAHLVFGRFRLAKRVMRGTFSKTRGINIGLEADANIRPVFLKRNLRRLRGRIVGGHAAFSPDLYELLESESARVIVIRRDPRDILVSFADWIGGRADYFLHKQFSSLDRDARIALLLRGGESAGYCLNPFTEVLRRAEGWLTAPGALQISFEDLIGAKGGGDHATQVNIVAEMHKHVRAPKAFEDIDLGKIYGGSLTFNKGRKSRWRELQSAELIDEINDKIGPHLATWGYET